MTVTATPEALLASSTRTCEMLGISLSTLDRLVEQEVLEPVRFTAKAHRRFRIGDIQKLAATTKEDD